MKYANAVAMAVLALTSMSAFAQASGTISNGTNSNAQQSVNVDNAVVLGGSGSGTQEIGYQGSYTVKSAPTVYAPSLTASVTETCLGSVSGGVSVIGVGATAAMTIENAECDRRLNAAVAGRMGRMDIAFNLMCQEDSFREASENTDKPCGAVVPKTAQIPPADPKNVAQVPGQPGVMQYKTAQVPQPPVPGK
jgi:hypothetical protein